VGVPPFYLVTLACGTVAVPFGPFLTAALVGTAVRYAVLSLATVLVRGAA
jgi:membrane protein YqaA with SNARE-associated domain